MMKTLAKALVVAGVLTGCTYAVPEAQSYAPTTAAPTYYYYPSAPVQAAPVYAPAPQPVYVAPAPVYYAPPPAYYGPGYGYGYPYAYSPVSLSFGFGFGGRGGGYGRFR